MPSKDLEEKLEKVEEEYKEILELYNSEITGSGLEQVKRDAEKISNLHSEE